MTAKVLDKNLLVSPMFRLRVNKNINDVRSSLRTRTRGCPILEHFLKSQSKCLKQLSNISKWKLCFRTKPRFDPQRSYFLGLSELKSSKKFPILNETLSRYKMIDTKANLLNQANIEMKHWYPRPGDCLPKLSKCVSPENSNVAIY